MALINPYGFKWTSVCHLLPILLYYLCCSLAFFKGFIVYNNYSYYICHVEMQLNDVIKSISWYRAFVALLIQTDTTKNSTDTDTGIGIGASLANSLKWSDDSYMALLTYSIPLQWCNFLPAELLMGRRPWTTLPILHKQLTPHGLTLTNFKNWMNSLNKGRK